MKAGILHPVATQVGLLRQLQLCGRKCLFLVAVGAKSFLKNVLQ